MRDFNSIALSEVQSAPLSNAQISFNGASEQIVFAKTNLGNYAKLLLQTDYNLKILDITIYDPTGTVIKDAANVTISGTCLCDVDQAVQATTAAAADFHWNIISMSPGVYSLVPKNGALFYQYVPVEDPTIDFDLLGFSSLQAADFSTRSVSGAALAYRIVFAKTTEGNYAKFQLKTGSSLNIIRLTLYNPEGCIIKTAANISISGSGLCDLDNAAITGAGSVSADFQWKPSGPPRGSYSLVPQNGASFHLFHGFDEITFKEIKTAPYETKSVPASALKEQVLFLRTSTGFYAKVLLNYRTLLKGTLEIRRLVYYDRKGTVLIDLENVTLADWQKYAKDKRFQGLADFQLGGLALRPSLLVPSNGAAISFQSHFKMAKYSSLLKNVNIINSLGFYTPADSAVRYYDRWTREEKLFLNEYLYAWETRDIPVSGPPALTGDQWISFWDAWKIYVSHVAQSLWFDANTLAAWRLAAMPNEQLNRLLHMRYLCLGPVSAQGYEFSAVSSATLQWNPDFSYQFMAGRIDPSNQLETIKALLNWCRENLVHILAYNSNQPGGPFNSSADQYEYLYGYRAGPLADKMISPLPGRDHVTAGCGGTTAFLALLLRTVNIPVFAETSMFGDLSDPNARADGHSQTRFPSVGQNLAHGDDPYDMRVKQAEYQQPVPIEAILYSDSELDSQINNPAPLAGLTKTQTTTYYQERKFWGLAIQYTTFGLVYQRCFDLHSGALPQIPKELTLLGYSAAQIQAIEAQADSALAVIAAQDGLSDGCDSVYKP